MKNSSITGLLEERIAAGDFPSAVYLVANREDVAFCDALGWAVLEPERIAASVDTIYDLASLTKVLATSLLAAMLIEQCKLSIDTTLGDIFERDLSGKEGLTVLDLATHSSGLMSWMPFYLTSASREGVLDSILSTELASEKSVVYSDLNFLLLMFIIEKLVGERIDLAAERLIFKPLGLVDTSFSPDAALRPRIAASEKGNAFERQTCIDRGYIPATGGTPEQEKFFRHETIWGEVHDGNAFFMDGKGGHAGMFSTAAETLAIARQFRPATSKILRPETCELFTTNFTPELNEHRSFGFQLASTPNSTAGSEMAASGFGHLGFTGTSLWIDPVAGSTFILLTNRTHGHNPPFVNINSVRRRFHELAGRALRGDS